jgi:hypothetical protein
MVNTSALIALLFFSLPSAQMTKCTPLPTGVTQRDDGLWMRRVPGGFEWSDDTLFRVLRDGSVHMRDNGPVSQPIPDKGVRPDSTKKDQRPPRLD